MVILDYLVQTRRVRPAVQNYIKTSCLSYFIDSKGQTMISIVYGSLEAGLPYNRAEIVGSHGRHLRPIFANLLYQLPTLSLPLFTCHAKVAIILDSLFLTW
jgi:hypothetical protein